MAGCYAVEKSTDATQSKVTLVRAKGCCWLASTRDVYTQSRGCRPAPQIFLAPCKSTKECSQGPGKLGGLVRAYPGKVRVFAVGRTLYAAADPAVPLSASASALKFVVALTQEAMHTATAGTTTSGSTNRGFPGF